jgi:hypothetical protein
MLRQTGARTSKKINIEFVPVRQNALPTLKQKSIQIYSVYSATTKIPGHNFYTSYYRLSNLNKPCTGMIGSF